MKKVIIAALLAASGVAFADTVGLYGSLNYGLVNQSATGLNATNFSSTVLGPSVFGIRGNEKLGNSTSAGFNLESAVSLNNGNVGSSTAGVGGTGAQNNYLPADGNSTLFYRQANVTFGDASIGEFKLGRQLTPTFQASFTADALSIASGGLGVFMSNLVNPGLTGNGALSGVTNPLNSDLLVSPTAGAPTNYSNGIGFKSASFGGFTVHALAGYNQGGSTANNYNNTQLVQNVVVGYSRGPVTATYGYQYINDNVGNKLISDNLASLAVTVDRLTVKGAYYGARFGQCSQTTAGGNCQTSALSINSAGTITPAAYATAGTNYGEGFDVYSLGGSYQLSAALRVAAEFTSAVDTYNSANKINMSSAYTEYNLSKHSSVYALASVAQNKGAANMGPIFGQPASAPTAGAAITALATGVKYTF